ncbi:MAG: peptide deformylase [Deltaproteobacteria bacterium]|nr:peptide deformylase [Deltaproteobacteria bacterium]
MAVLPILHVGHPNLRLTAREVTREELALPETQAFIDDLVETMHHANGAGLAATQVDRPLRICAIEVKDNPRYPYKPNIPLTILVNPVLEPLGDDTFDNEEGCLSVPNLRGGVRRFAELRVTSWDRHGATEQRIVRGITAGTFQHEVDHLDGKLFLDRVEDPRTLATWDQWKAHRETAFIERVRAVVARYGS